MSYFYVQKLDDRDGQYRPFHGAFSDLELAVEDAVDYAARFDLDANLRVVEIEIRTVVTSLSINMSAYERLNATATAAPRSG